MSAIAMTEIPGAPVVATCSCCLSTYTAEEWARLKYVGTYRPGVDEEGDALELRDCPCRNTLSIVVPRKAPLSEIK